MSDKQISIDLLIYLLLIVRTLHNKQVLEKGRVRKQQQVSYSYKEYLQTGKGRLDK